MAEQLPDVGRPRGNAWRQLTEEGIVWEGQILITGDEADLAALLIITNERLAFVRGGSIALDVDREWLYPTPVLRRTGSVLLWIAAPDSHTSDSITVEVRAGRREAARMVSLLSPEEETWATPASLQTYVPTTPPQTPDLPLARSWSEPADTAANRFDAEPVLPVFEMLDDDDFPPIVARSIEPSGWGWNIDLSGDIDGPVALAGSVRKPDSPLTPVPGLESRDERAHRAWIIRLSGLVAAFALFAGFASGLLPGWSDIQNAIQPDEPTVVSVAEVLAPTPPPTVAPTIVETVEPTATASTVSMPQSTDPMDPTVVPQETAEAMGVGGMTETTDEPEVAAEPTEPPAPTAEPTLAPTETPFPTEAPTEVPEPTTVSDQVAAAQDVTETPVDQTPIIPPPAPTDTIEPTATPETAVPTEEVTATSEVETGTEATPSTTITGTDIGGAINSQSATIDSAEVAADSFALNGGRYTIEAAYRSESVPELTLGRSKIGEWVVLIVSVYNWSDAPLPVVMPDFRVADADDLSTEYPLDTATGSVAAYLGMSPALGMNETGEISTGSIDRIALVFSVPTGLGDLALRAGEQTVALGPALTRTAGGFTGPGQAVAPELVEAQVVDVIDGRTIVVEVDGNSFTVQYPGISVPAAGECFADESTTANSELMVGQTVFLERERRSRDATDVFLRDAWVDDGAGNRTLASAILVANGVATASPEAPDIRFAGWLSGENLVAQQNGTGLWSACEAPAESGA